MKYAFSSRPRLVAVLLATAFTAGCGPAPAATVPLTLPDGFAIEIWADGLANARSMVLGDRGTLFVSTRKDGRVFAVEIDGDGRAGQVHTLARDLYMPNGIAFREGDLYVAEVGRVLRFDDIEGRLADPPKPEVIFDRMPRDAHHGWRYMAFGPDDKLYVSIGAPCNVCDEPGYDVIIRLNPDGSGREVYARGVRNSVGLAWHPETGELWFTDNGRDWLGDDRPPDELNRAPAPGMHFGYPYCHGGDIPDPDFGEGRDCGDYEPPALRLGPHVAALGLEFYTGEMFPEEYRGQLFIAEHGSWNRSEKVGYRVSLVRFASGRPVSYQAFASGWLAGGEVSGRPVDLLVLGDGSMLVSDDRGGRIYRITYNPPAK